MVYEILNDLYKNNPKALHILLTHSLQVKETALLLASQHPEWEVDKDIIGNGAIVHDIGIIFCNAPIIECYGPHCYIEHGFLGAEFLREKNLPHLAHIAERHTGTGITKQQIIKQRLPLPHRDFLPETLEEKIICFADKFYSKTHLYIPNTITKIRYKLERDGGKEALQRWDELYNLMGITDLP